ncbi:hypothetical protein B0T16DRAFT_426841 [Cercophora newfieldiana]|uniref:DUF4048 domain-containing protein n=1 Tax=Cercophora newfieldiana TaxID=92897 RepID=A0AA39YGN0_9PEZI|nr:hypothetical protein B0T16DRAFT_426841 [Cercophora newfieldiana]
MTSVRLLQNCCVSASASALFLRDHPLGIHKASVVARRTTRPHTPSPPPSWRRHRRNCASPATPYRRRRTSCAAYHPDFLRKTSLAFASPKFALKRVEASQRPSLEKLRMEQAIPLQNSIEDAMLGPMDSPVSQVGRDGEAGPRYIAEDFVPPSPSPSTRSTRSTSSASRTNRLSLTLPIAPPTAFPSRPTPVSSTAPSFPPTPLDSPSLLSPADSTEFITAIAAQERRVLELREELSRAELDLTRLKKQWANHEAYKKRVGRQNAEPLRPIDTSMNSQDPATHRSVELDRRKALLNQLNQQNTPERARRRVFRGGHTRTLSLLSPTKATDGFSVHEDASESFRPKFEEPDSPYVNRYAPITPSQISKRASWAPRSTVQSSGVKQIAQDLRYGLWTFVEDLRQATVGEEPITGQGTYLRGNDGSLRSTLGVNTGSPLSQVGDQDTIRASGANSRPRAAAAFEEVPSSEPQASGEEWPKNAGGELEPTVQKRSLTRSNTEGAKSMKRFSWTPLTVDSYDDNDWSNWDSPSVNSASRWSGTTVNGDIIPSIPEKRDENDTPLKSKSSKSRLSGHNSSPSAHKLEELLPPMLNRLAPSNLKKATSDLMREWERSLYPQSEFPTAPAVASADRSS